MFYWCVYKYRTGFLEGNLYYCFGGPLYTDNLQHSRQRWTMFHMVLSSKVLTTYKAINGVPKPTCPYCEQSFQPNLPKSQVYSLSCGETVSTLLELKISEWTCSIQNHSDIWLAIRFQVEYCLLWNARCLGYLKFWQVAETFTYT